MADGARLAWTAGEEEVFWTEVMYDGTFGLKLRCNSWAKYAAKMQEKMIARTGSKDMLPRDYTEKNCCEKQSGSLFTLLDIPFTN